MPWLPVYKQALGASKSYEQQGLDCRITDLSFSPVGTYAATCLTPAGWACLPILLVGPCHSRHDTLTSPKDSVRDIPWPLVIQLHSRPRTPPPTPFEYVVSNNDNEGIRPFTQSLKRPTSRQEGDQQAIRGLQI